MKPSVLAIAASAILLATCRDKPVDPQELLTAQQLGLTDLRRGQLQQAEEQFRKVIELAPRDPLGYANLGLTYLRGGRFEEADEQLARARKLAPQNVDVGLIQARLYHATNRPAEARRVLGELGRDPRVLYALAELDSNSVERLRDALAAAPTNVAVRLRLADALIRRGVSDSAAAHLDEIRRQRPEPPVEARPHLDSAVRHLRAQRTDAARQSFDAFMRYMELTSPYQASLEDVKWLEGPIVGRPVLAFNPQSLISARGIIPVGRRVDVRFVDATSDAGFPAAQGAATAVAIGDYDNDGADDIFVASLQPPASRLYHVQGGYVADVTDRTQIAAALPSGAQYATFADFDNDGWLDLFAIGGDGRGALLRNRGDGSFENVTATARVADVGGARKARFFDADHDGDIDLLLIGDSTRLLRNNMDGTFADVTAQIGLGGVGAARDAAFADFDDDGRVDLSFARANGDVAMQSTFQGFRPAPSEWGPLGSTSSPTVAVADLDNDGWLDLAGGGLWRKAGSGGFVRDTRSETALRQINALSPVAAEWMDYDNDGWSDLVAVGAGGARLLRNDGRGRLATDAVSLPALRSATSLAVTDIDGDGDQDLLVGDAGGVHLLRNDGGNARMAMQVQLVGLRAGSGKNNTFGLGAKISMRTSEIFQTRVVTSRITHFGLGTHLKADVVRVQWTNGVPETIYFPGTDADILELEQLKGSCAFLYTWDGTRFRFVTDVMWQSALGMPLGLMAGGGRAYAPAGPSREYLRVPGEALRPRDGRYVLQITEELWETAYLDEIKLVAVDHPDSVEVFVDERFPPRSTELRMSHLVNRRPVVSAVDETGRDLLPLLREKDDVYVGDFRSDRYQGVVAPHELILDLGPDAGRPQTQLVLRGWIYPSDASINVALSQQSKLTISMPSLEVRNARGQWETVIPAIGFPSGKDKTVILDLTGKFPTRDHRVRIRTNMAIYWDQAFVATHAPRAEVRTTRLAPMSADLHFRGYSRMYRKGGGNGPHWFDYDNVTKDSPWRTITGAFTRFGNVLPLLGAPDDMYVVMAPGDETTIAFDASTEATLPRGWKRTFLLYTDGWIKDADLNTAHGQTVEPLPFHANRSYPYEPGEAYPSDSLRQAYRREYNTRVISR